MAVAKVRDLSKAANKEVPPRFCLLNLEDLLIWDNWIMWEQVLRRAQHEWDKSQAFLAMDLLPQFILAKKMTKEE